MLRRLVPVLVTAAMATSCSRELDASDARWVRVIHDPNYVIYLDTALIQYRDDQSYARARAYEVWYRTDHALPREHQGKTFTREIVRSIVMCDSMWFRVASVDMSMGDDNPVALQRSAPHELARQRWRRVGLGTSEEVAARAACHFIQRREGVGSKAK